MNIGIHKRGKYVVQPLITQLEASKEVVALGGRHCRSDLNGDNYYNHT